MVLLAQASQVSKFVWLLMIALTLMEITEIHKIVVAAQLYALQIQEDTASPAVVHVLRAKSGKGKNPPMYAHPVPLVFIKTK